jgi:methionyl-tRNA synthetase
MSNFYITTTLPYVNSEPHIGFALEIIKADCLARWHRFLGEEVFFNTGTDEHGLKIYRKAQELNISTQDYCDQYAEKFKDLKNSLNLSYNSFIRTTDKNHITAVQEFWKRSFEKGDIYKKIYKVKYCVGCELEKTDSELVNDRCPIHPNQELELIEEENYFFKFSNYQKQLLDFYEKNPEFVLPKGRFNEIKKFVEGGLRDFSVSRLKEKMPWGVEVPGDAEHVMYVWFDALVNYIACLGWPEKENNFSIFWPGWQICGKDNLRQQSAMWQAMLMSAGLPNSKKILINGFITVNGEKMSKSLGNVINPLELVEKYGSEAVRYYFLAETSPFEDSDFTYEKFEKKYNADLANGLGNLISRVSNLIEKNEIVLNLTKDIDEKMKNEIDEKINNFLFNEALSVLWKKISEQDEFLSLKKPWKMEDKNEIKDVLEPVAKNILNIGYLLEAFLPETSKKIVEQFTAEKIIKKEGLFNRLKIDL